MNSAEDPAESGVDVSENDSTPVGPLWAYFFGWWPSAWKRVAENAIEMRRKVAVAELSAATGSDLLNALDVHLGRLQQHTSWRLIREHIAARVTGTIGIIGVLMLPWWVTLLLGDQASLQQLGLAVWVGLFATGIALLPVKLQSSGYLPDSPVGDAVAWALCLGFVGYLIRDFSIAVTNDTKDRDVAAGSTLMPAFALSVLLVYVIVADLGSRLQRTAWQRRRRDSALVESLTTALVQLRDQAARWPELSARVPIAATLQQAADRVLPGINWVGDPRSPLAGLARISRQISERWRTLSDDALDGRRGADEVAGDIARDLELLLTGRLTVIASDQPEPLPSTQNWASGPLRLMAVAALPGLALAGLQVSPYQINGKLLDALSGLAVTWAGALVLGGLKPKVGLGNPEEHLPGRQGGQRT